MTPSRSWPLLLRLSLARLLPVRVDRVFVAEGVSSPWWEAGCAIRALPNGPALEVRPWQPTRRPLTLPLPARAAARPLR